MIAMDDDAHTFPRRSGPDLDELGEPPTLEAGTAGGGVPGTDSFVPPAGYALGEVIGRGGMGEVVAATCQRIGRDVAIKRMRAASPTPDQIARFLREARVQARLDHPAIVPVHELGYDTTGHPYFAMKRLAGVTLEALLARGTETPQRLLRGLVDVCLAIELAHTRGVVHRDLKPANIMLGDYGEVYVLDWGVARVLADGGHTIARPTEIESLDGRTQTGDLLGTLGYMAPEQLRGEPVRTGADVYALGAILFEIIAREPLHPRGHAAIASTLTTHGLAGPAARRGDGSVPPELDAACLAALAADPASRPSARALADRIQHYLDGDRDVAQRRTLAAEQVVAARDALAGGDRATAMRCAGQAIALDPASTDAGALVSRLMLEPPTQLPPELAAALAEEDRDFAAERNRMGAFALLAMLALAAFLPWAHVKSWPLVAAYEGAIGLQAMISWRAHRRRRSRVLLLVIGGLVVTTLFARVCGPFMLTPLVGCGVALSMAANPWFIERAWAVAGWMAAVTLIPVGLELTGVVAPTWGITDDVVWMRSAAFQLAPTFTAFVLVFASVLTTVAVALYARAIHRARAAAQRRTSIQAWHLRKLLPTELPQ